MIALAEQAGLKAVPTGIDHGTVTVIAEGKPFEVTTLRRDVETFGRHAKVAYTTSWEEDAKRRDFTLNALYADRDGNVFDPIGGYGDLQAGRVRFIGEAEARIKEDYLRILRFFRFHAYYGKGAMDAEGLQAAVRLRAGLEQLSAERVAGEMRRILVAPGAVGAVEALFDYGLLTNVLGGVPRLVRFERLVAIEEANGLAPSAALRLAALAVFVEEDVARLADRLRLSNAEQAVLALGALGVDAALPGEEAAKALLYRLGPDAYRSRLLLAWADADARPEDGRVAQRACASRTMAGAGLSDRRQRCDGAWRAQGPRHRRAAEAARAATGSNRALRSTATSFSPRPARSSPRGVASASGWRSRSRRSRSRRERARAA